MENKKLKFKQKYTQGQKVGQGKMGVVYKVQKKIKNHLSNSSTSSKKDQQPQFYAAKHISLHKVDLELAKKQLKILQQLKHMYIVRYYEDFVQNDELILIMDYCEGKDLAYLIQQMKKKGKFFNESLVSTWIFQLILVVQYIHSCNIIHRDLKPQNIFVDREMNLKIGDFGVSKLLEGTENCKTMIGTPFYYSPQLVKGDGYSKKTDIWSLGCVIYQICTLEKPFTAKRGFIQLINVIQTQQPKNIPSLYSSDLNKLIRKMLIKDPKKRPTSRQLLQDPILVQLMINYSSQVNLKQQYEKKPMEKPSMSNSFIQGQANAVNERMLKFQNQIKQKMEGLKNKKVKSTQIDNYYADVQSKMKNLQKIVDQAFKQLKQKSQPEQNSSPSQIKDFNQNNSSRRQTSESQKGSKINNSSNMSESDITIKSVNLGSTSKISREQEQKQLQQKILSFNQTSSIDSVNSVFIESTKRLKNSSVSNLGSSSKLDESSKLMTKKDNPGQFQATLKSQFVQTLKNAQNPSEVRNTTISHIDEVSKVLLSNPNLIFDETFLDVTLSLSNNEAAQIMANNALKKKKGDCATSFTTSHGSSSNTINFDFSKKDYEDSLAISSKKAISQDIPSQKDSLEEYYQADFDSYQEDKQMDIRQQQKKSVKQLFASTLKNLTISKNDSGTSSNASINPRNKYNLTLSTIREQSSQGGSTISYNEYNEDVQ